jgi:hypothetical protein
VVQRTGWGKSFVYFIATKLLREVGSGLALLFSPLLALMRSQIAAAARGTLGNYVPFNFCPRSVMLYVVAQGHENCPSGQWPIVHLVSSTRAVRATGRPWFFTDRHADLGYASQFDTLDRLDEVDWSVMPLKYWSDPDVKERRQAEFQVHDWCP